jgi:hypothetical protein
MIAKIQKVKVRNEVNPTSGKYGANSGLAGPPTDLKNTFPQQPQLLPFCEKVVNAGKDRSPGNICHGN